MWNRHHTKHFRRRIGAYVGSTADKIFTSKPVKKHVPSKRKYEKPAKNLWPYKPKKKRKVDVKKERKIQADDISGAITDSTIRINQGRKAKASIGTWKYNINYASALTSPAGGQYAGHVLAIGSAAQMVTSTGSSYNYYQSYTALQQLNPYLTNTGSTLLASNVNPATDEFVVKRATCNFELTNLGPVSAEVDFYVLTTKKNINSDATQVWTAGYTGNAYSTSAIVPPAPGTATATAGYPTINIVGSKPRDSKLFREMYKIESCQHISLANSASHTFKIDILMNKHVKADEMNKYISQNTLYVPNFTVHIMVVSRGVIVQDVTNSLAHHVTYGSTYLGYIADVCYYAHAVRNASGRLDVNYAADQIPYNTTVDKEEVNEVTTSLTTVQSLLNN